MVEIPYRIGQGHDTHRIDPAKELWIGGVRVEADFGLSGHSDADVLLHALVDAILGALGKGDIGEHFPNTASEWKDANSALFLKKARTEMETAGWQIGNLDAIIFAERPKFVPWKPKIRKRLAELLEIEESQINVKAKTGEKVDAVGRGEAMQASCIVLLVR